MVNFYVYSFSIAAIPLLLGVLLIWFGKKLWKKANAENAKYQQRYTGRTTLRVIGVEKHERESATASPYTSPITLRIWPQTSSA